MIPTHKEIEEDIKVVNNLIKGWTDYYQREKPCLKNLLSIATAYQKGELVRPAGEEEIENILPEKKSILAECAYQGGGIPKNWMKERTIYIEGYNKAREECKKKLVGKLGKAEMMSEGEIQQVLGWCYTTKENEHKEMDVILMGTIVKELSGKIPKAQKYQEGKILSTGG